MQALELRGVERNASDVNWNASAPSWRATQICDSPERFDRNASWRASGDRLAIASTRVEATAIADGDDAGAPGAL
jgi:hypothetical protein